jgi:hypothetical protein
VRVQVCEETTTVFPPSLYRVALRSAEAEVLLPVCSQTIEVLSDAWELDLRNGFSSDTRGVWRRLGEVPFPIAYAPAIYHPTADVIFVQGGLVVKEVRGLLAR